jgi:hypothetical protein
MFCFVNLHPISQIGAETDVDAILGWMFENVNVIHDSLDK